MLYRSSTRIRHAGVAVVCAAVTFEALAPSSAFAGSNQSTAVAIHRFAFPISTLTEDPANQNFVVAAEIFNFARPFTANGQNFVMLINGNVGSVRVHPVVGQELGAAVWSQTHTRWRCTGAAISGGATPYVFLHDSFTGRVNRYPIANNGSVTTNQLTWVADADNCSATQSCRWQDRNIFTVYRQGDAWRIFTMDTWSGHVTVAESDLSIVSQATWTRGYSSVDHVYVDAANTYRVLHKASGDPYKAFGEAGDSAGLVVVQKVSANGLNQGNRYTGTDLAPDFANHSNNGEVGWSHVRFAVAKNTSNTSSYGVFYYDRRSGAYEIKSFNSTTGAIGAMVSSGDLDPNWTDFQPFVFGTFGSVVGLNYDNVVPFHYDEVERMSSAINERLSGLVVGYQLMLSQSGQIIHSRAEGMQRLDQPVAMATRARHDLGSVSKMITTFSLLELSASTTGSVDLTDPISDHVAADEFDAESWINNVTVQDALSHTTGMSAQACTKDQEELTIDCRDFYAAQQSENLDGGALGWKRDYNNDNTQTARRMIERYSGTETSPDLDAWVRARWMTKLGITQNSMSCLHTPEAHYFAQCHEAPDCIDYNNEPWQQSLIIDGWSSTCGAGGWSASSRGLIELLHAIRYAKILPVTSVEHTTLLDTSLSSGGRATALGWESPWIANGEATLGKNGSVPDSDSDATFSAYITRLPGEVDAVLLLNTAGVSATKEAQLAYNYAKDPIGSPMPEYVREDVFKTGDIYTTIAINEASTSNSLTHEYVVGGINSEGELTLTGFSIASGSQIVRGDSVTESDAYDIQISDGTTFVTAVRNEDNHLRVIGWNNALGTLVRSGDATGDYATEIAVTKAGDMAGSSLITRAVTAIVNAAGKLQVDVWDADITLGTVSHVDSSEVKGELDPQAGVEIETLIAGNALENARVITAMRDPFGELRVDVWDVLPNGSLDHVDATTFVAEVKDWAVDSIAIDARGDGSAFFDGSRFATASISPSGSARVSTWEIDAADQVSGLGEVVLDEVTHVELSRGALIARNNNGNAQVTKLDIQVDGTVYPVGFAATKTASDVFSVVGAGRLFSAHRDIEDELVVTFWRKN